MRRSSILLAAACAGVLVRTPSARADLIAYEGFDYTAGTTLNGQNGGIGFGVNTWVFINSASPGGTTTLTGESETFSGNASNTAAATGGAAFTASADRRGRMLDTTSRGAFAHYGYLDANGNIGADGKSLYVSFTQRSGTDTPNSFFEFEFKRNDLGDGGRVMGIGDDVAGNNMNLRTGPTANQSLGVRDLKTNLYVLKIDFLPGNDRVSVYRNPTGTTLPANPTLQVSNADVSFDGISMGAFIGNQTVYTDEIRMGTSFSDVITGTAASVQQPSKPDQWRPGFHYSAPKGWLNDPNGLIYRDGKYHLYYQAYPPSIDSGPKSWGHATSTDLVHWAEQPLAIAADNEVEIYSGCTLIDTNNTAGFGAGAMLAFYTGASRADNNVQDQRLAYSLDGGQTFAKTGVVIPAAKTSSGENIPTRDPAVSWDANSNSWVMAVSRNTGGSGSRPNGIEFYRSSDLKTWNYASTFGGSGWECPDLFESPLTNAPAIKKSVLMVAANGSTYYHIGSFNGTSYAAEKVVRADYGPDFYAAQQYNSLRDSQGRDVVITWMSNPGSALSIPAQTWRGEMTVPRTVEIKQVNGDYVVLQNPVAEIDSLRRPIAASPGPQIIPGIDPLDGSAVHGDMLDLVATIDPASASKFGFKVHVGPGQETIVGYDVASSQLYLDRSHSSSYTSIPLGTYFAPLALQDDGTIQLRILVDRSSVEVFANGGLITMTALNFAESASTGVSMFAIGGTANLLDFQAYALDSSIPEPAALSVGLTAGLLLRRRRRSA